MTRGYDYVAYIDEAGDTGLNVVGPHKDRGTSEWFVLGAAVIRAPREPEVIPWLDEIRSSLRVQSRAIHFANLREDQKLAACRAIAKLPARYFVAAFNKKNMERHRNDFANRRAAELFGPGRAHAWFLYWCMRVLLEKVSAYVERKSLREFGEPRIVRVEFEEDGRFREEEMRKYLTFMRSLSQADAQFLKQDDLRWSVIDVDQVLSFPSGERAGLQLPDIVASAFFHACDTSRSRPRNIKPALALRERIAKQPSGWIAGYGVKLMPHLSVAKLTPEQEEIFARYGYRRK